MQTVSVKTSGSYDIFVGSNMFANIAGAVKSVTSAKRLCIVSDNTIWPLWGNSVLVPLKKAGYDCCTFLIAPGEGEKCIETCMQLWEFLAKHGFDRNDCLIALGGGVIGDLTGFSSATYLRGIDYIQIPTTLLAMVDSSVGGKTAINLQYGKNLVGAFYQPKLVLCNTDTLCTLPRDFFLDGCAEVIKYAILFDPQLFSYLEQSGPDFLRQQVIYQCINYKAQLVSKDEFDRSERMLLNLGHTVGHAIELLSDYTVSHGQAVASGIACVSRLSVQLGILDSQTCSRIVTLLEKFQLPTTSAFTAEALFRAMSQDKKRSADILQLIVPCNIGQCQILSVPQNDLKDFIQKGL